MAYHHGKTCCPTRDKNYLVFFCTRQTCSAIKKNEQPIEEIFYGKKISFKVPMTSNKKVSF